LWPAGETDRFIVCTGGEPLLQLDRPLIDALHARDFEIAIETNGTILPPGLRCAAPGRRRVRVRRRFRLIRWLISRRS